MGPLVLLAFAAGFLLVFGLNLFYSDLESARRNARRVQERADARELQNRRARLALQHRDIYELAASDGASRTQPSLMERIELYFEQAGLGITFGRMARFGIAISLVAALVVGVAARNVLPGFLVFVVFAAIPFVIVVQARRKRLDRLLAQLPNSFDLIARMMRAGQTFPQAMLVTAEEIDSPLSEELTYCCDQQRLGLSADAALRDLARRVGILEIRIFVLAVLVHRQTGGNLSSLLESLAAIIRERYRIKGIVSSLTAEGRTQAWILMSLPVLMLLGLTLWNPLYVRELYLRPWLLATTAFAMLLGAVWMRRIVNFDN